MGAFCSTVLVMLEMAESKEAVFAEVEMGVSSGSRSVRATVVQASTIFYDTPATLGMCASSNLSRMLDGNVTLESCVVVLF